MKATLETPLTRLPRALLVWLDGSASTTVETTPARLIREMRPPSARLCVLPVYGAAAPCACGHLPTVECEPPRPPSATYRAPSGPKVSPRGLFRPAAKTDTVARRAWCCACAEPIPAWALAVTSLPAAPRKPTSATTNGVAKNLLTPAPLHEDHYLCRGCSGQYTGTT